MFCERGNPHGASILPNDFSKGNDENGPGAGGLAGRSDRSLPRRADSPRRSTSPATARAGPWPSRSPRATSTTAPSSQVMSRIRVARCGPGRPRTRPGQVAADKGYSSTKIRAYLCRRGIKAAIPERIDQINGRIRRGESRCRLDPRTSLFTALPELHALADGAVHPLGQLESVLRELLESPAAFRQKP